MHKTWNTSKSSKTVNGIHSVAAIDSSCKERLKKKKNFLTVEFLISFQIRYMTN